MYLYIVNSMGRYLSRNASPTPLDFVGGSTCPPLLVALVLFQAFGILLQSFLMCIGYIAYGRVSVKISNCIVVHLKLRIPAHTSVKLQL